MNRHLQMNRVREVTAEGQEAAHMLRETLLRSDKLHAVLTVELRTQKGGHIGSRVYHQTITMGPLRAGMKG